MVREAVAALEVRAVTAEGKAITLDIRIERPARAEAGDWRCAVEVKPLYGELGPIRGVDSFHCLWLACSLVLRLLDNFRAGGGKLYDRDGGEFPLDGYLAGLGGKAP